MQHNHVQPLIAKIANYRLLLADNQDSRLKATLGALIELAERELAVHVRNGTAVKPMEAYAAQRRRPADKLAKEVIPDPPSAQVT